MPMTLPLTTDCIDKDAQAILRNLPLLQTNSDANDEDEAFLRRFFRRKDLQMAMKTYKRLCILSCKKLRPVTMASVVTAADTYCHLRRSHGNHIVEDLMQILAKPHFQALLYTHDKVASREYEPVQERNNTEETVYDDSDTIKIVQLVKSNEPLGVTIQRNDRTGVIEVARIMHGGAAHRSGLINVGDEIYEINGIQFLGRDPDDMAQLLARIKGPVTLKIGPRTLNGREQRASNTKVKALFDYNPYEDSLLPCPDAGLPFNKGDILHVLSQEDPMWWQAKHDAESNGKAGLIPARLLQERRELLQSLVLAKEEDRGRGSRSTSPCRISPRTTRSRKVKKIMYQAVQNGEFEHGEIPTYEEVELMTVTPGSYRPLVLIGASNVGRNELKRRLIMSNPGHYMEVVPYTSRKKRPFEEEGREYHFITREEMESGILARRFVEHGEFKGNLYGTRADSIQKVIHSGKVCIITPSAKAIRYLRTSNIRPFVVFIKPPPLSIFRDTRKQQNAMVTSDTGHIRLFSEEDFEAITVKSTQIEECYGHYFDRTIVNDNLLTAVSELVKIAQSVEQQPQWVPVAWVQ